MDVLSVLLHLLELWRGSDLKCCYLLLLPGSWSVTVLTNQTSGESVIDCDCSLCTFLVWT